MKLIFIFFNAVLLCNICFADSIYDKQYKDFQEKLSRYDTLEVINNKNDNYFLYVLNLIDTDELEAEAYLYKFNDKVVLIEKLPNDSKKITILHKYKHSRGTNFILPIPKTSIYWAI